MSAEPFPVPTATLRAWRDRFDQELFERVIPFWERHSPDRVNGGYFNCLDRDGSVYDTTKHVWMQGRQAWMFAKLFRTVDQRPEWLEMARLGVDFLRAHALRTDGRAYFSLTADGRPVQMQRKIFSECFVAMALAEYGRASGNEALVNEARVLLERIASWAWDWTKVGRPSFEGAAKATMLAVPMILLNLYEEIGDGEGYRAEVDDCLVRLKRHVIEDRREVREWIGTDGAPIPGPDGRIMNPGHVIEAGWFVQHWARRLGRPGDSALACEITRWAFDRGWDAQYGGLFYFLDAEGYSPLPLEWSMKLWWPHTEAMYALLLNWSVEGRADDWERFERVANYSFERFSDRDHAEWFGYLDRRGEVTHRFKGGPYKGCFHVPRSLWMGRRLLDERLATTIAS